MILKYYKTADKVNNNPRVVRTYVALSMLLSSYYSYATEFKEIKKITIFLFDRRPSLYTKFKKKLKSPLITLVYPLDFQHGWFALV